MYSVATCWWKSVDLSDGGAVSLRVDQIERHQLRRLVGALRAEPSTALLPPALHVADIHSLDKQKIYGVA